MSDPIVSLRLLAVRAGKWVYLAEFVDGRQLVIDVPVTDEFTQILGARQAIEQTARETALIYYTTPEMKP